MVEAPPTELFPLLVGVNICDENGVDYHSPGRKTNEEVLPVVLVLGCIVAVELVALAPFTALRLLLQLQM